MACALRITKPTTADIAELGYWRDLAGVHSENVAGDIAGLTTAHTGGYLGCALGHGIKEDLRQMVPLDFPKWYYARSAMHTLKLDAETIGVITVGPSLRLWTNYASQLRATWAAAGTSEAKAERALTDFAAAVWPFAKISLLAVRPNHQRRGHGARLVRHTLDQLRRDRVDFIYGQYGTDRPHLAQFYAGLGFRNCDPGEALTISGTTFTLQGRPDEAFFVLDRNQPV